MQVATLMEQLTERDSILAELRAELAAMKQQQRTVGREGMVAA